jgi:hypothetical protein
MPSHADVGEKRYSQSNQENEPQPPSQTTRLIDEPGIPVGKHKCGAYQAKDASRCANGCTGLWVPAVNKENHKGRGKYAAKIDRCGQRRPSSPLQNSGYPEKQQHIDKQMHPIEMQKRIRSEAPVLSMQVPVVWKCT